MMSSAEGQLFYYCGIGVWSGGGITIGGVRCEMRLGMNTAIPLKTVCGECECVCVCVCVRGIVCVCAPSIEAGVRPATESHSFNCSPQ
jgi:hypothetical protein